MARHKRRSFRGFGMLPTLSTYNSSVKGFDVIAGAGVGLLGVIAAKYASSKWMGTYAAKLGVNGLAFTPLLGGLVAGIVAFAAQKKSNRGAGHLIGAALLGASLTADTLIKANLGPGGTVAGAAKPMLDFYAGIEDYGALVPDSSPYGALMQDSYGALVPVGYAGQTDGLPYELA